MKCSRYEARIYVEDSLIVRGPGVERFCRDEGVTLAYDGTILATPEGRVNGICLTFVDTPHPDRPWRVKELATQLAIQLHESTNARVLLVCSDETIAFP